jgi:hypothetical protein
MKTTKKMAGVAFVLALAALIGAGALAAQTQTQTPKREVFCEGLSAGQLCVSGAPRELKLEGAKLEQWRQVAREYNKSVDAATKQLLAQSKTILTTDEYAKVERWFDKGLNEVLNQILLGNQVSQK